MKTRIFIETKEVTLPLQMASFINGMDADGIVNIFFICSDRLNEQWLKSNSSIVFKYKENTLLSVLDQVAHVLIKNSPAEIEIHADLSESYDLIIPLLMKVSCFQSIVHLHVYEGSLGELVAAAALEKVPDYLFNKLINDYGNKIKSSINNNKTMLREEWSIAAGYSWHKVLATTYHLQENSEFKNSNKLPCEKNTVIDEGKVANYLELFKIPHAVYSQLRKMKSSSLLLLGTSPRFPSMKRQHQQEIVNVVRRAMNELSIDKDKIILFRESKGGELNSELLRQFGNVAIRIPDFITVNLLRSLQILPLSVGGFFSDELYQAPAENALFVLTTDVSDDFEKYAGKLNFSVKNVYRINELSSVKPGRFAKRIFYCPGSMGDAIYALGALTAFRVCHDEEFIFITHKLYNDLIISSPVITECWDINALTEDNYIDIELARQTDKLHILGSWEQIVASEHMTDAFIGDAIHNHSLCNKQPLISLKSVDKTNVDSFIHNNALQSGKVVLLHPNIGSPNRTWTENGWNQLAEHFVADGWKVIVIGSDNNKYQSKKMMTINTPEVINCINQFSALEMIYLMEHCQLLVACDSGPVALAGLTSIAICALYSIIPASYRLPYRNGRYGWNALGIDTGCQFGQCGHLIMSSQFFKNKLGKPWVQPKGDEFSNWCPNDKKYQCMKKVTAEYFWHQIQLFIRSDNYMESI